MWLFILISVFWFVILLCYYLGFIPIKCYNKINITIIKMNQGVVLSSIKFLVVELIGEVLYFPIWWYSRGAKKAALFFVSKIVITEKSLGVGVWLANLFKPMFGQNNWQGIIISFVVRLVQIIIRTIALLIWSVLMILAFLIWLALPLIIVYQIYFCLVNLN